MRRGTTPPIAVRVKTDLTGMSLHLSFREGRTLIVKTDEDIEMEVGEGEDGATWTTLSTGLTQAETLSMRAGGTCEVQLRAVGLGGELAIATTIGKIPVKRILEEGVIDG